MMNPFLHQSVLPMAAACHKEVHQRFAQEFHRQLYPAQGWPGVYQMGEV
jgi:hypothetical protein